MREVTASSFCAQVNVGRHCPLTHLFWNWAAPSGSLPSVSLAPGPGLLQPLVSFNCLFSPKNVQLHDEGHQLPWQVSKIIQAEGWGRVALRLTHFSFSWLSSTVLISFPTACPDDLKSGSLMQSVYLVPTLV